MPDDMQENCSRVTKALGYLVLFLWLCQGPEFSLEAQNMPADTGTAVITLPTPDTRGSEPLESTLAKRRSIRRYRDAPLNLAEVAQLLWAAQGITSRYGYRTAPSAGALYPLELYVTAGKVSDLEPGIYRYQPGEHSLVTIAKGDRRAALARAALGQKPISQAPAVFIFVAVPARTAVKYGQRSTRYVLQEVGHAAQNLCLQAVALDIGSVVIGAFQDGKVAQILKLQSGEVPICIVPVGKH